MRSFVTVQFVLCRMFLFLFAASSAGCHFAAAQSLASLRTSVPLFHKNVDLVLVTVSVLDRSERSVTGLTRNEFAVLDDRTPQTVKYFSHEDTPIALAVVLDASASMAKRFEDARHAMEQLIATSNVGDEFHIVVVGDSPRIALDPCDSLDQFQHWLAFLQPDGQTALWDSMMAALEQLRSSSFTRKAMVVITDGGDNHSRTNERELKSVLKEAGVEMYAVALYDPFATRREERIGPLELDELTSVTGGRVFSVRDRTETLNAASQISRELRDEYVLGYYPTHPSHDGKWHKVRVSLSGGGDSRQFRVIAKKGYFQPAD